MVPGKEEGEKGESWSFHPLTPRMPEIGFRLPLTRPRIVLALDFSNLGR